VLVVLAVYIIAKILKHRLSVIDDIDVLRRNLRAELDAEREYARQLKEDLLSAKHSEESVKQYFRELMWLYRQGKCEHLKLRLDEIDQILK